MIRTPPARLVIGLVVVAVLATLPAARGQSGGSAGGTATRPCAGAPDAVRESGRWRRIAKPAELDRITAHAAGGPSGKYLLVTDGKKVMRSIDGGCSWQPSYEVPTETAAGTPLEGQVPTIVKLLYPERGNMALMALDGVARTVGSRLLVSSEHGEEGTWTESTGLPLVGGVRELRAGVDEPEVVYAALGESDAVGQADPTPGGASGQLFRSDDGGKTFALVAPGRQIRKLAVDPVDAKNIYWVTFDGKVFRSTDSGATAMEIPPPAIPAGPLVPGTPTEQAEPMVWSDIAIFRRATIAETLVVTGVPAQGAEVTRVVVSFNKGGVWTDLPAAGLGPPGGVLVPNGPADLYSTGGSTDPSFRGPAFTKFVGEEERWVETDPFGLISLMDPSYVSHPLDTNQKFRAIVARRDVPGSPSDAPDELVRYIPEEPPDDAGLRPQGKCDPNQERVYDPPKREGLRFAPGKLDLKLQPGVPSSAELKAKVPGDPIPVDVYFLLDNSESQDPAIEALSCSIDRITRTLPKAGLDAHFGLGAYNDVQTYTYRRLVDIEPPSRKIIDALRELFTLRGSEEPLRSALFQTATGAGLKDTIANPDGMSNQQTVPREVPPGQQANFRDKVLRTTIVIGDEPYEPDTKGEPAKADVIAALKAKDIKVLGVRVNPYQNEQVNPSDPDHHPQRQLILQQQLEEFARETGAVAPAGGVDCDGSGKPDVAEGGAVVCTVDENGISEKLDNAIVALLRALAPPKPAEYVLRPKETSGLAVTLKNGEAGKLDEHRDQEIEDVATVSCTNEQAGRQYPLSFEVLIGERVVGLLEGTATCGELPAAVVPPPPIRKQPTTRSDPPRPAPERPVAPEPPALSQPAPATINVPQPAVAVAPPPPPPAPAPLGSVPAQAAAPSNAVAPAPGQGAAVGAEQQRQQHQVATIDGRELPVERAKGDSAIVGRRFNKGDGDLAMVGVEARSPVPVEAVVTLGVGLAGLIGYVGVAAGARRRRKVEPARADGARRRSR